MADQTMTVTVIEHRDAGKVKKFKGVDAAGTAHEFTISTTSAVSQPPDINEYVDVDYNEQIGEWQGKQQITKWANEIRLAQPPADNGNAPEAPQEIEEPKKAPGMDIYEAKEMHKEQSIEKSVCLKAAIDFWKDRSFDTETLETIDHLVVKTAQHYWEAMFSHATPQLMHHHDGDGREPIQRAENEMPADTKSY